MKKQTVLTVCIGSLLFGAAIPAFADIAPLPDFHHININVSNDNGAQNGSGPTDSYYIKADGGGLNQLHITTDSSTAGLSGQVTTQDINASSTSGTFWVSTTGGRGYNDSIILLASVKGPISNDFSLNIKSSGYQWTAAANVIGSDIHYVSGAVNETFGKSDFLYGPQTTKPGPGTGILPFYSGQNVNDPTTAEYLMFIDLWVGNTSTRTQTDAGSAKVEFSVSGLYSSTLAFNAYAFAYTSNTGANSIDWTNRVSSNLADAGQSGYSINTTAVAPVPVPAAIWLFGSALAGFGLIGRRKAALAE
ncbi:VPLPA-CTERM sorting domain-containing protein [Methylomonas albis]|uniref:VPLPA-CTERM sorting domain-containing protein n=1 Tax=Methylomonas albis TaxID=1854563 RepID=A0ABR9CWN7_9GAMM|nr:VPLPA-CTERM sorting domain-containing protein [Methylomonas albis]MBD9355292.1 VPLPA-CTERM sorting domain-containing protein [Methylomonas albis]